LPMGEGREGRHVSARVIAEEMGRRKKRGRTGQTGVESSSQVCGPGFDGRDGLHPLGR
jgi:hypothetical protein